jgi:polyisoprenoid-binding protein YceI
MKKISLIAAALLLQILHPAHAADSLLFDASESRIALNGSSTLHPYASTSTLTQVSSVLVPGNDTGTLPATAVLADIARRAPFQQFEVVIPVKGLKSGENGLDKNMYKSLKVSEAPDIRFALTHYETSTPQTDDSLPFKAAGRLSIAGVDHDIVLVGTAQVNADQLIINGAYELRMSDYGIKPPTLLLGAIKVADPVTIHFHLKFVIRKGGVS